MATIDFGEWTDAQLDSANQMRMTQSDPQMPAMRAEIQRRVDAGVWRTDGSHDRLNALMASARRSPRRRRSAR